jgi:hypothetical protein
VVFDRVDLRVWHKVSGVGLEVWALFFSSSFSISVWFAKRLHLVEWWTVEWPLVVRIVVDLARKMWLVDVAHP